MPYTLDEGERMRVIEWEEEKKALDSMIGSEAFDNYALTLVREKNDRKLFKIALLCKNRFTETGEERFRNAFNLLKMSWEFVDPQRRTFDIELDT